VPEIGENATFKVRQGKLRKVIDLSKKSETFLLEPSYPTTHDHNKPLLQHTTHTIATSPQRRKGRRKKKERESFAVLGPKAEFYPGLGVCKGSLFTVLGFLGVITKGVYFFPRAPSASRSFACTSTFIPCRGGRIMAMPRLISSFWCVDLLEIPSSHFVSSRRIIYIPHQNLTIFALS
jgi:hypothetical protein